jgi:hypothetical protein
VPRPKNSTKVRAAYEGRIISTQVLREIKDKEEEQRAASKAAKVAEKLAARGRGRGRGARGRGTRGRGTSGRASAALERELRELEENDDLGFFNVELVYFSLCSRYRTVR